MIRLLFVTVALVEGIAQNDSFEIITWQGGEKMEPISDVSYVEATRIAIFDNYAYLAFPRSKAMDVPITLARMNLEEGNEHKQYPFPNLEMQEKENCEALQNVVDVFVDKKGLLWVLDAVYWYSRKYRGECRPKIVAFNLTTEQMVKKIDGDSSGLEGLWRHWPLFRRMVVTYNKEDKGFIYVSEVTTKKIFIISEPEPYCVRSLKLDLKFWPTKSVEMALDLNFYIDSNEVTRVFFNAEYMPRTLWPIEEVLGCSRTSDKLYNIQESGHVYLGNNNGHRLYFRNVTYDGSIYHWLTGTLDRRQKRRYKGDPSVLPIQIVYDDKCNKLSLLETKTDMDDFVPRVTHTLKRIPYSVNE